MEPIEPILSEKLYSASFSGKILESRKDSWKPSNCLDTQNRQKSFSLWSMSESDLLLSGSIRVY